MLHETRKLGRYLYIFFTSLFANENRLCLFRFKVKKNLFLPTTQGVKQTKQKHVVDVGAFE